MKKRFVILLLGALLPLFMQAQNAQSYNTKCLGVAASYLFETQNVQGEIFFHLPVAKHWRIAPAVHYAFSYDHLFEWGADGNIHYLVPFARRFTFYPLVGITFQSWRGSRGADEGLLGTHNKFGANVGAGFEVSLVHRLNLHIEGKYIFVDKFHQPHISLGLGYRF